MSWDSSDSSEDACRELFWGDCSPPEDPIPLARPAKRARESGLSTDTTTTTAPPPAPTTVAPVAATTAARGRGSSAPLPPRVAMRIDKAVGIDASVANKVIRETSQGSFFYNNEARKQANSAPKLLKVQKALQQARADLSNMHSDQFCRSRVNSAVKEVDRFTESLEMRRDTSRVFFCIDLDMFYAAVEERDNPELAGKPLAVGGMSMLSTSNYVARQFGVRAAMPGFVAVKLCPQLIIVKPRFDAYTEASERTREVFAQYDADFHAGSLDEAVCEVTGVLAERDVTPEELALEIKRKVVEATGGLTCSIGCGNTAMLAKMASNVRKPDGFYAVASNSRAICEFMRSMRLGKVHGIGPVGASQLEAAGFRTVEDLWSSRHLIPRAYRTRTWKYYMTVCMGAFERDEEGDDEESSGRKSISSERTFWPAVPLGDALAGTLRKIVVGLTRQVNEKNLRGRTITVKMKASDFSTKQSGVTLPFALMDENEMYKQAEALMKADMNKRPRELRLIGVKISNFEADKDSLPSTQATIDSLFKAPKPEPI